MAKPTKPSKASGFDADKFLEEIQEQSRKEKEAEYKREALIQEYSIRWNLKDEDAPFPGMTLNAWHCRWEPENLEEFISEHGEEFKKYKSTKLTNQSGEQSSEQSPKSDSGQTTIMTKVESTPNPEPPQSDEPPTSEVLTKPNVIPKKTAQPKVKGKINTADTPPEESPREVETPTEVITTTDTTIMTTPDKAEAQPNVADTPAVTGKATRISAKMRRASRQEFHDAYLVKTDTKGGKPITISADLIKRLYRICARSGDYRACPTYLVNNLLMEILDVIEPDTEGWAYID